MPFNIDGFLSSDSNRWVDAIRIEHKDWFDLAESSNGECMKLLPSIQPLQSDDKQLVASLIFGRIIKSFQSVILLIERGLAADARTLVRSCAESAIALGMTVVDNDFINDLISDHTKHRTTVANVILSNTGMLRELDQGRVEKLKILIDEYRNDPRKSIKWDQAAQKAGFSALYDTVYRETSSDAAHVTIESLNRHLRVDSNQNIVGIIFYPETDDIENTLSAAISALLHSLDALKKAFERPDVEQLLISYIEKWKALNLSKQQA